MGGEVQRRRARAAGNLVVKVLEEGESNELGRGPLRRHQRRNGHRESKPLRVLVGKSRVHGGARQGGVCQGRAALLKGTHVVALPLGTPYIAATGHIQAIAMVLFVHKRAEDVAHSAAKDVARRERSATFGIKQADDDPLWTGRPLEGTAASVPPWRRARQPLRAAAAPPPRRGPYSPHPRGRKVWDGFRLAVTVVGST